MRVVAESEVFPNPTVSKVIFQIRFPDLFYVDSRMGEFQLKVIEMFPVSALAVRRQFLIAEVGPTWDAETFQKDAEPTTKLWQFKSANEKITLEVASNSLSVHSSEHKSYNNPKVGLRFRDCVRHATEAFFALVPVPRLTRVGLRYIDDCPVPSLDDGQFREWYNTTFPLDRFCLGGAREMMFHTTVARGDYGLRFTESLVHDDPPKLRLDFDAFATDIPAGECLDVTDRLHELLTDEWKRSIKGPVYDYMRKEPGHA